MESLPNIIGEAQTLPGKIGYLASRALSQRGWENQGNVHALSVAGTGTVYGIAFDASHSSSTYQDNAYVHPLSMSTLLILKY